MAPITKIVNYADDAVKYARKIASSAKGARQLKGKVHYATGEILAKTKVKTQSIPTQQYIDDMLGIGKGPSKEQHLQRYKDLKAAFNGKAPKPVTTTSRKTIDVVHEMNNVEWIDQMRKAEVTGELPEAVKNRRLEILEAFETQELKAPQKVGFKVKLKNFINGILGNKTIVNECGKYVPGYNAIDYNVPGGHVPAWAQTKKGFNYDAFEKKILNGKAHDNIKDKLSKGDFLT